MWLKAVFLLALAGLLPAAAPGFSQERPAGAEQRPYRSTVWDLDLGMHAREISRDLYVDLACGTNGGPPSLPLTGWRDFATCKAEPVSGLREVYFRYDDELEYRSLARDPDRLGMYRFEGTTEFQVPVIVSALFDDFGFLTGIRVVSDPRTDVLTREKGGNLAGVFMARFGEDGFVCTDLPRREGESAYRGALNPELRAPGGRTGLRSPSSPPDDRKGCRSWRCRRPRSPRTACRRPRR